MKISVIAFCFSLPLAAFAQGQIKGTVADQSTREFLAFANVFINNTTVGTTTDEKGEFLIKSGPVGQVELVVSYVGYQTYQQKIQVADGQLTELTIKLMPVTNELQEVQVHDVRDKSWEKKFRKFEKEFLGQTANARRSKVLNPWVVDFVEGDKITLAVALDPLEIENLALGYRLFFYLKRFEMGPDHFRLLGITRFENLQAKDEEEKQKWEANRARAYLGSDRHLFHSIVLGTVEKEGFLLYAEKSSGAALRRAPYFNAELRENNLIPLTIGILGANQATNEYKIRIPGRVEVHYTKTSSPPYFYKDVTFPVSWLEPVVPIISVNGTGVLTNPESVKFSGYFITRRVADMLPVDYLPPPGRSLHKEN